MKLLKVTSQKNSHPQDLPFISFMFELCSQFTLNRSEQQLYAQKKGQISVFLLVGIILLLTIFMIFQIHSYYVNIKQVSVVSGQQLAYYPPQKYIEFCVEQETVLALVNFSSSDTFKSSFLYQNKSYPFVYTLSDGNTFLTFQTVSEYLDNVLPDAITKCFDTSVYENAGFNVNRGIITTQTTVFAQSISIDVITPFEIANTQTKFIGDSQKVVLPIPIGGMIQTTNTILNAEISEKWFDQIAHMQNTLSPTNNPYIFISKHKEYPHTLYALEYQPLNITFYFAIEGVDTFLGNAVFLERQFQKTQNSCCRNSQLCAIDVSESRCLFEKGFFEQDCACEDESTPKSQQFIQQSQFVQQFDDCGIYHSGESWCEYTSGVGGRFMRIACIDGNIVQEPCRDYKQEVCVSELKGGKSFATCRPNSAQNCATCTTQNCCEQYDCQYVQFFTSQSQGSSQSQSGVCIPKVPLGFKFWDADATYCQDLANHVLTKLQSSENSKNEFSLTQKQLLCSVLSDCGYVYSYQGDFGANIQPQFSDDLKRLLDNPALQQNRAQTQLRSYELASLDIDSYGLFLKQIDDVLQTTQGEYLDPDFNISLTQNIASYCAAFTPSLTQNKCELCGTGAIPCSEYSCKSLGSCAYALVNGSYVCQQAISQYTTKPILLSFANKSTTQQEVRISPTQNSHKFVASDMYYLDDSVFVTVQTPVPSLCKASFIPVDFYQNQVPTLTKSYSLNHTFSFPLLGTQSASKLLPFFGLQTSQSQKLGQELVTLKFKLEQLQLKYPLILKFNPPLFTTLNQFVQAYTDDSKVLLDESIKRFYTQSQLHFFVNCVDELGAKSNVIIGEISFSQSCSQDFDVRIQTDAKEFVKDKFFVYTDVLASCKYSVDNTTRFEDMTPLTCPTDYYAVSANGYACELSLAQIDALMEKNAAKLLGINLENTSLSTNTTTHLTNSSKDANQQTSIYIQCLETSKPSYKFNIVLQVQDSQLIQNQMDSTDLNNMTLSSSLSNLQINSSEAILYPQEKSLNINSFETMLLAYTIQSQVTQVESLEIQFPKPVQCALLDTNVTCVERECILPPLVSSQTHSLSCETKPESLVCGQTPRYSQMLKVELRKPPEFSISTFIRDKTLHVVSSDATANCQYRVRNLQWFDMQGLSVKLQSTQSQIYEVMCTDYFGQTKSAFISG
jgi:hypothetical protein